MAVVAGVAATAVALTAGGGAGPAPRAGSGSSGSASPSAGPSVRATFSPSARPTPSGHAGQGTITTSPGGGNGGGGGGGTATTPAPPIISLAIDTDPSSPVSVTCGTAPPTVNVTGNITTGQAATVTYQWMRSDGTSSSPKTTTVDPTATAQVIDPVTPSSDSGTLTDTLQITSPARVSKSATVTVSCTYPALAITSGSPLPAGTLYASYSAQVSASGGDSSHQWSASGLPSGLSIDPASGVISGDPQATGSFTVTVTVTDGESTPQSASATLSLTIYSNIQ